MVRELAVRHRLGLQIRSIEKDPGLEKRYGEKIPALEFRGYVLGWGRLSPRGLEREISRRLEAAGEEAACDTLIEARRRYFSEAGLGEDGGYNDRWVKVKLLGIPLAIPNTEARRRAVRYHDLHHVLTGYGTDWPGEAQISAWEIASGCRNFVAAWVLNLYAMGIGIAVAPVRTYWAFLRGCHSSNLYGFDYGDQLLGQKVEDVCRSSGLADSSERVCVGDSIRFAGWAVLAAAAAGLPFVAIGWALIWIAARYLAPL